MVQGIQIQGLHLKDIPLTEKMLKTLLIHPLQIQVGIAEIYSQMWVRNGLQIKGQAMTYIQCHFCYSMVDADLYLMQVIGNVFCVISCLNTLIRNKYALYKHDILREKITLFLLF